MRLLITFFLAIFCLISCSTRKASSGLSDLNKLGQNPIWFVDSIAVAYDTVKTINPMDISNISVLLPKSAKRKLGDKATDGAVYVTTTKAAKQKYWRFFSSKSNDYRLNIKDFQADTSVVYVLNGQTLSDSAIGALYLVDKKNLKRLQFTAIDSLQTSSSKSKYKKNFILNIEAKRPKHLKNDSNWK